MMSLVARRVREARRQAGYTQTELAERAGVTRETINRCERDRCTVSLGTLKSVAKALGISPGWLLNGGP